MTEITPDMRRMMQRRAIVTRVIEAIRLSGHSTAYVARQANMSDSALRLILDAVSEPRISTLDRIADACGVSFKWLLVGVGDPRSNDAEPSA